MGILDVFSVPGSQSPVDCRKEPGKCTAQIVVDGAVIIFAYAVLLYAVEGAMLPWRRALKFYGLFVFLAFLLRYVNVDFQEQLTRVAGFQLGTKLFMSMAV